MASYTPVSVSNYNAATVPVDDGTVTAANKVTWSGIKTKLADPLKTAIDSIDDNIATAISTITTNLATSTTNLGTTTSTYTTTIGRLYAPTGTVTFFVQTAAPTGWTKGSTHNDKALRLVSGAVTTGGSTAFTSIFTARTITSGIMPAHTHAWATTATTANGKVTASPATLYTDFSLGGSNDLEGGGTSCTNGLNESEEAFTGTVNVSGTSDTNGSGTAMDFAVRYVDIIVATKD